MPVPINWLAIVLCMVAAVVLGFVWYGPLFGKKWMALSGIAIPNPKPPMSVMTKPIIISLIGAFFMSFGLTHNLTFGMDYLNIYGVGAAFQGAFWNWLSFIVPVYFAASGWEGKSWKLFFIHAGYWLVLLLIMALIIVKL